MANSRDFEQYDDWRSKQEKPWNRLIKNLEPKHYILMVVLIGFAFLIIRNKNADRNTILIIGAMVVAIVVFLTLKSSEGKLLTEDQVKIIVTENLKAKIPFEYPTGTRFETTGFCALRLWGRDNPYKWEVGVLITYPNGREEEIMVALNPFSGQIMKKMGTPAGWTATEAPDIKPVYPYGYYGEANNTSEEGSGQG